MRSIGIELGYGEFAVQTTTGLGSTLDRPDRVTTYNYGLLGILAAADIVGLTTRIVG